MELKQLLDFLSNAYLYGWAGTVVFFVLFVITVRQSAMASEEKNRLEREKSELEADLSEKKSALETLNSQVNDLEEQLEEKKSRVTELKHEVESLEKKVSEYGSRINDLESQIDDLRTENQDQKSTIQELEAKLSEAEAKARSLETDLSSKESELSKTVDDLKKITEKLDEVSFSHDIAALYIELKKLQGEFSEGFTQNILKGIHTMQISEVDLVTAQNIFEAAMASYYKHKEGSCQSQESEVTGSDYDDPQNDNVIAEQEESVQ